jgi:glycosyltransferase involved in cell wall biosynthesis
MAKKDTNVLILTSTYPRWVNDSTPPFVQEFAKRMAKKVDKVYVLAPHYAKAATREASDHLYLKRYRYFSPATAETIAYNGGGVDKIKKSPLYAVKLLFFITSLFFNTLYFTLRYNITIINAHWLVPQGFIGVLVKLLTGHTLVITIHGGDVLSLNGKYMKKVKRFTLRHADIVYVNSSVTEAVCRSLYDREYLRIPMGVSMEHFKPSNTSTRIEKKYDLHDFTILFVGRLAEEKGVIYLLEAVEQLRKAGKQCKALIIGVGPVESELNAYITSHDLEDVVTMVGWVGQDELPDYYGAADVFVGPSLREAQGIVFIEALAAGLPVVTTNQGGMKDFIQEGKNGFMVEERSSEALFAVLKALYTDRSLLKRLSKNAPVSIREGYSWESTIDKYYESWRSYIS